MADDEDEQHRRRVRENADYHVRQQELRRERESARASVILADFIRDAEGLGIPPTTLFATPTRGPGLYRTNVRGWYLRRDRSLAVSTDGRWYVLTVPRRLIALVTGQRVEPQPPPLQVGEGARDGESVALTRLLELRLQAGRRHP